MVAYGALLPQRVLDILPHGWINLHFSLLPAWRGAAPVQHAILAGDQTTGATTFRIVLELDAGPTFGSGHRAHRAHRHRRATCWSGCRSAAPSCWSRHSTTSPPGSQPQPQPEAEVSYAVQDQRRGRQDRLDRAGRGHRPADPGLLTRTGGLDHLPRRAVQDQLGPGRGAAAAARACWRSPRSRSRSAPARRALELGPVQAQGKKPMAAADWARGVTFDDQPDLGLLSGRRTRLRRIGGSRTGARRVAFDALRAVNADGAYANLVLAKLLAERALPVTGCGLRHRAAGRHLSAAGQLRRDHRGRFRPLPGHLAAGRRRPAAARRPPDPLDARTGARRRRGHGRPGRRHGGRAGHRRGERHSAPGGRPRPAGLVRPAGRRSGRPATGWRW